MTSQSVWAEWKKTKTIYYKTQHKVLPNYIPKYVPMNLNAAIKALALCGQLKYITTQKIVHCYQNLVKKNK